MSMKCIGGLNHKYPLRVHLLTNIHSSLFLSIPGNGNILNGPKIVSE